MQLLRWNNPGHETTRASSMLRGAGCRELNPRVRRREKNVLDIPFYRSGHSTSLRPLFAPPRVLTGILSVVDFSSTARPASSAPRRLRRYQGDQRNFFLSAGQLSGKIQFKIIHIRVETRGGAPCDASPPYLSSLWSQSPFWW